MPVSILSSQILLRENITVTFATDQNGLCFLFLQLTVSDYEIFGFVLWKEQLSHSQVRIHDNCYVCQARLALIG